MRYFFVASVRSFRRFSLEPLMITLSERNFNSLDEIITVGEEFAAKFDNFLSIGSFVAAGSN